MPTAPATAGTPVTLDVWRLTRTGAARAMLASPRWNRRPADPGQAAVPGFARLLGTGDARFTPSSAVLTRWALLRSPAGADPRWARRAAGHFRAELVPLAAKGSWAGATPFVPDRAFARAWTGEVLALTRARLRPARAARFWRSVPPVAAGVPRAPGLLATMGVGEAPLGYQGTLSLWRDAASVAAFAWRDPAHRAVVDRTPAERWYAEELFARFAVVERTADLDVWAHR